MRSSLVLLMGLLLGACVSGPSLATRHRVLEPEPEQSLLELADNAARAHDWTAALSWLRQAEAEHPEQVGLARARVVHARWIERGEACDFEWLERRAHARIEDDPRDVDAWAELARLHLDRAVRDQDHNASAQVAVLLADADRIGRESAALEFVRALHAQLEGHGDLASAAWRRALELDPSLDEARLRLGVAYLEYRDFAQAEAVLHGYVERRPDDPEGWLALGVAYAHGHATELARAAYHRAAELAPDDPRPHWNLAWLIDNDDWERDLGVRQRNLATMFATVRANPLPDCEVQLQPDPQCIARAEARRQMLLGAKELEAVLEDSRDMVFSHRYPERATKVLREQEERLEKERRTRLLELEKAAARAGAPGEVEPVPKVEPPPKPRERPLVLDEHRTVLGEPCR